MTPEAARLQRYVDTWAVAVDDVLALLRSLDADDWSRPTDCPGWDVRAVVAHLAHLEAATAGWPQPTVEVPEAERLTSPMSRYTEQGPLARASWSGEAVLDELEAAAAERLAALRADPPTDPAGAPPHTPAGIPWPWETLLSNRPFDVWIHEQDVRRAVDRPGGYDGPPAAHAVEVLARSLPFVVGKRVAPPAGTTVVLRVTGPQALERAVQVGDDGRAAELDPAPADPTVALTLDTETFVVLAAGRRRLDQVSVDIAGDQALGEQVLASLAITP